MGEEYNFFFSNDYDWYGEVSEMIMDQSFVIKMTQCELNWLPTSFGFNLSEGAHDVILQFFHSGWKQVNHEYRKTSYCWALLLHGLKRYVEVGEIIPFEERG